MVLYIKKKDLEKIFQHAKECYPIEACGILAGKLVGKEKIIEKVYPTKNILNSIFEYQIDPIEQIKIFEEAKSEGLNILGFYHSHPHWDCFWSTINHEKSKWWIGYSFLIVSLKTYSFSCYVREKDNVEKEEIKVTSTE
jgi:proteasome lid subunit RPN8/RPN11